MQAHPRRGHRANVHVQGPTETPCVVLRVSDVNAHVLRADRPAVTRALTASLATAANPARGGLVREALAAHFPRLAQLLEDTLGRLARDTQARPPPHVDFQPYIRQAPCPYTGSKP